MSNMRWYHLASITFKEALRDRVFNLVGLFAIVLMAGAFFAGNLSAGSEAKVVRDMALAFIQILLLLVGILLGSQGIHRDIERRTIFVVLSKPVRRGEYLLGKLLGIGTVLLALGAAMTLAFVAIHGLLGGFVPLHLLPAIPLMLVEATVFTAMALLFSSLTSPTLGLAYCLGLFLVGHTTSTIHTFTQQAGTPEAVRWFGEFMLRVVPNLEVLDVKNQVVYGDPLRLQDALWAGGYGLAWTFLFLGLATLSILRREV
ncbi:MAG: ABC transporter permease subunit [Candidatus Sericytochromatia bacterium]|nr:ABC transporter permease subunit [Candidatus Sericytochromatia bacterium]